MMVALGKVLPRGQVTVPRSSCRQAGFEPGDTLTFRVRDEGVVEVRALPRLTFAEALKRYRIEGPVNEKADRAAWQAEAAKDVIGE
jgi:bifunctional DNA-binding transcriptional regulator/antitoxin component of YhaV-PrlF toxin-antitoxin module